MADNFLKLSFYEVNQGRNGVYFRHSGGGSGGVEGAAVSVQADESPLVAAGAAAVSLRRADSVLL